MSKSRSLNKTYSFPDARLCIISEVWNTVRLMYANVFLSLKSYETLKQQHDNVLGNNGSSRTSGTAGDGGRCACSDVQLKDLIDHLMRIFVVVKISSISSILTDHK